MNSWRRDENLSVGIVTAIPQVTEDTADAKSSASIMIAFRGCKVLREAAILTRAGGG